MGVPPHLWKPPCLTIQVLEDLAGREGFLGNTSVRGKGKRKGGKDGGDDGDDGSAEWNRGSDNQVAHDNVI